MNKHWWAAAIVISCFAAPVAFGAAPVYKWTDAQGNVHFSDRPDELPNPQRIEVSPSSRGLGGPPPAPATSTPSAPAGESAPLAADAEAQRQVRVKNCEIARESQKHNEGIDRMFRLGPDGERVFLTDEEREEVLRRSRDDVEKWCD